MMRINGLVKSRTRPGTEVCKALHPRLLFVGGLLRRSGERA